MQSKNLLLAMLLSFTVAACGGGGAAGAADPNDSGNASPPTTSTPDGGGSNPDTGGTYPDAGGSGGSGSGGEEPTPPETLPPMTGNTFVAYAPYAPAVGTTNVSVDLGAHKNTHDFSGNIPFFNPEIGRSDIATINVWNSATGSAEHVMGYSLTDAGVSGRVFKQDGYTAIGVKAGDGIVEEKLRTQVNAFPIPTRRHFEWQMKFKFGGRTTSTPWHMAPVSESPATIWQFKTYGFGPPLLMAVDTDPDNAGKLRLSFAERVNPNLGGNNIALYPGVDPNQEQDVRIEAYLDERTPAQGGRGFFKITVNGKVVFNKQMQTTQTGATSPYNWSIGMYLFANTNPLPYDRFIYFKTARLVELS